MKKITIFGGSGFLGSYIVRELAKANYQLIVFARSISKMHELKLSGNLGQISLIDGDIRSPNDVIKAIGTSEIVINLVGILDGTSSCSVESINHLACKQLAEIAAERGVKRFIHFSALVGCKGATRYGKSKIDGENAVKTAFPGSVIIRPSVIFGEEDNFVNLFVKLSKKLRFLLLPSSKAVVQPVYVGDLARLLAKIVQDEMIENKSYNVAGEKKYTLDEICSIIEGLLAIKIFRIGIPYWMMLCEARVLEMSFLKPVNKFLSGRPNPIITREQVRMLKYNSTSDEKILQNFDIQPTTLEEKLKCYIKSI